MANKKYLIKTVASKQEVSFKEAAENVNAVLDSIVEILKEKYVLDITKFAKFEVKATKARLAHNPQTLEKIAVPEGKRISIKQLKALKELVKQ